MRARTGEGEIGSLGGLSLFHAIEGVRRRDKYGDEEAARKLHWFRRQLATTEGAARPFALRALRLLDAGRVDDALDAVEPLCADVRDRVTKRRAER